jgi:hypothetical protein
MVFHILGLNRIEQAYITGAAKPGPDETLIYIQRIFQGSPDTVALQELTHFEHGWSR